MNFILRFAIVSAAFLAGGATGYYFTRKYGQVSSPDCKETHEDFLRAYRARFEAGEAGKDDVPETEEVPVAPAPTPAAETVAPVNPEPTTSVEPNQPNDSVEESAAAESTDPQLNEGPENPLQGK